MTAKCRCGHEGTGPHPCHGSGYQCRAPASSRLYNARPVALSGIQFKLGVSETWACDACWAEFRAQLPAHGDMTTDMSTDDFSDVFGRRSDAQMREWAMSILSTLPSDRVGMVAEDSSVFEVVSEYIRRLTAVQAPRPVPEADRSEPAPGYCVDDVGDDATDTESEVVNWIAFLCAGDNEDVSYREGLATREAAVAASWEMHAEMCAPLLPGLAARIEALEAENARLREENAMRLASSIKLAETIVAADVEIESLRAAQSAPSGLDETKPPPGWTALPGRPGWCSRDDDQICKRIAAAHSDCRDDAAPYIAAATRELRAERDAARVESAYQLGKNQSLTIDAALSLLFGPDEARRLFPALIPDTSGPQEPTDSRDPDDNGDWKLPDPLLWWAQQDGRWIVNRSGGNVYDEGMMQRARALADARNLAAQRKRGTAEGTC